MFPGHNLGNSLAWDLHWIQFSPWSAEMENTTTSWENWRNALRIAGRVCRQVTKNLLM
jgi:hypothetical protein